MSNKLTTIVYIIASIIAVYISHALIQALDNNNPKPAPEDPSASVLLIEIPPFTRTELLKDINFMREKNGKPALEISEKLNQSAQLKANHMLKNNYWDHDSPDGMKPWDFLNEVEYRYRRAGENLAKCYPTPQAATMAWYESESHRANMLGDYTQAGFGIASEGPNCIAVVNHLGTPL